MATKKKSGAERCQKALAGIEKAHKELQLNIRNLKRRWEQKHTQLGAGSLKKGQFSEKAENLPKGEADSPDDASGIFRLLRRMKRIRRARACRWLGSTGSWRSLTTLPISVSAEPDDPDTTLLRPMG
jgi:hypothetical protein